MQNEWCFIVTYEWSCLLDLGTAWSVGISHYVSSVWFVKTWSRLLAIWWQSSLHHHLTVSRHLIVLVTRHDVFLTTLINLLSVVPRQLFRIDHWKHFRETLANSCNSLWRVPEWKFAPWHVLHLFAIQINDVLGTWSAWSSTQWLLSEHCIIFIIVTLLAHE